MLTRRQFMVSTGAAVAAACGTAKPAMTSRERVDLALKGEPLDRPPYTFYYHFGLENEPGERHAAATLDFHRKFGVDVVKVMSDFAYPKPEGDWFTPQVSDNPFPQQIKALELIRDGLSGKTYFIETIFNSWNQAEKISSKEEVLRLKEENPQALLDALEAISKSQASHARKAIEAGAAGIFLAIANAQFGLMTEEEYSEFSEPFDRMILEAVADAPLNTLHLHGDKVYLHRFHGGWPAAVIQYSPHTTGVPIEKFRQSYGGVLMAGIDETNFRTLSQQDIETQWRAAASAAGPKFILAPGCSVPNDTAGEELQRMVAAVTA
jgi:uroporphyrinogen decarboxylase